MRVKKKDLRKRLPQLPINYPGPVIEEPFNYELEASRVENLCRRLADNEVETRDACLAEVPRFIRDVCSRAEFVALANQKSLPKDFSYDHLAEFLSTTSANASVISAKAAATNKTAATDDEHRALFSQSLRDLALIFDKLNLGLFYNLWHSDKPLVQHDCSLRIAVLTHVPPSIILKLLFWRSMWRALAAKWSIIDHHRLDKYMAYVRKVVFQTLRDVCDITVQEANPVLFNDKKKNNAVISAKEIVADAMRLVGNDLKLKKYLESKNAFKTKLAFHQAAKRKRREEHEAKMAARSNKQKRKAKKDANAAKKNGAGKKDGDDSDSDDEQEEEAEAANKKNKNNKNNGDKKENNDADSPVPDPAAAIFLTAFSDMIRVEVFQCGTSVGLAMHLADVSLDEIRRQFCLHKYPSVILAYLFAVPLFAMASGDVLQIERRVSLMLVQPIAGGVFERFFVDNSANASESSNTKKPSRKGPSLKVSKDGEDEDDYENGNDDDEDDDLFDEFDDDEKVLASADPDAAQEKKKVVSPEVIEKSANLAEAVSIVFEQLGLDPRTKFLMRPLFEENSRAIRGYILHRRQPTEFELVTPSEKRKMLLTAVHKKVFAMKGDDENNTNNKKSFSKNKKGGAGAPKKLSKKKVLQEMKKTKTKTRQGKEQQGSSEGAEEKSTKLGKRFMKAAASVVLSNAATKKITDPKQLKLLKRKKAKLAAAIEQGTTAGKKVSDEEKKQKFAVKSKRRRLNAKKGTKK